VDARLVPRARGEHLFSITTHDAGHRITDLDFMMARHIDAIAAGHGAEPVLDGGW
jgi:hypothetical protein